MAQAALSQGPLLWSGEHWILYLRPPGSQVDSGQLSLYCAAYSPAGQGTVAYIDIPGSEGLAAVCTDNPDLADFITATMIRGSNNPFDRNLPNGQPPLAALATLTAILPGPSKASTTL